MSDPMQNINAAAEALALVAEKAGAPYDAADAEIAERRDAYDALAADLFGVVEDKLDQRIYVDAANGDNTASGSSLSPVASIQEAFGRLVPGSFAEVRLNRGDTYTVTRDEPCSLDNGFVQIQIYGNAALPIPIIQQGDLKNINGYGYSSGFQGKGLRMQMLSCALRGALNPDDLPQTAFNGFFTAAHGASLSLQSCDIELGANNFYSTPYGEPAELSLRSCSVTRHVGLTGYLLNAAAGIFRATSSTPPSGETWADVVNGQVYAADGECKNFATNVTL